MSGDTQASYHGSQATKPNTAAVPQAQQAHFLYSEQSEVRLGPSLAMQPIQNQFLKSDNEPRESGTGTGFHQQYNQFLPQHERTGWVPNSHPEQRQFPQSNNTAWGSYAQGRSQQQYTQCPAPQGRAPYMEDLGWTAAPYTEEHITMHGSRIPPPQKGFPSHSTTLPSTLLSEINVNAPAVYHDFTYLADELVNRTPTGASVAEPDSVIGESGRLYHGYKEGKYFFPNDAAEQDRLDFQHTSITLLLDGKLTWAPMTKAPKYVMDVATGTGIWAIEFANQNPSSQVVGTDLSKIQPENAPANCTFEKEDSEEEWLYSHKFDYVHLRAVFSCFDNPKMVMRHAFQNLNPGGWIEYHDGCPTIQGLNGCLKGTSLQRWSKLIQEGAKALGRDIDVVKHYKRWLIETGFVDVEEKKLMWPLNPWPRGRNLNMVGRYQQINFSEAVRPVGWKLLRGAGLSPEEVEKLTSEAKREIPDQRIRAFISFYVVYGRKPFEGERKGPVFGEEDREPKLDDNDDAVDDPFTAKVEEYWNRDQI